VALALPVNGPRSRSW